MKRLLSIMLALMLVLSMTATAFATEQTKVEDPNKVTSINVIKTYNDPVGYGAKFFFDVKTVEDPTIAPNTAPTMTIDAASFAANHDNDVETATIPVQITDLRALGVFKYTVTEHKTWGDPTDTTAPGVGPNPNGGQMMMSKAVYEVAVTVAAGPTGRNDYVIDNIVIRKIKDDAGDDVPVDQGKVDALTFVNTYVKEAGVPDDPTTGALLISKKVVNELNSNDQTAFSFTVNWTYPAGGNPLTNLDLTGVEGATLQETSTGGTATFNLKGGQNAVFTGLPIGTVINVEEAAMSNYKPSAKVTVGAGTPVTIAEQAAGTALTLEGIAAANRTLLEGKNVVEVTNTYNYIPTTGVILNVLPYVLMVAIAGGMIALFTVMKRRKAQDSED